MNYAYSIISRGTSGWDNLENIADKLQNLLDSAEVAAKINNGWELWQINTLNDDKTRGFLLVFRRPLA